MQARWEHLISCRSERKLAWSEKREFRRLARNSAAFRRMAARDRVVDRLLRERGKAPVDPDLILSAVSRSPSELANRTMAALDRPETGARVWTARRSDTALLDWLRGASGLQRACVAFAAVALLVGGLLCSPWFSKPRELGRFVSIVGTPVLRHAGDGSGQKAQISSRLLPGDRIETGDTDQAEVRFNDGTTLRLNFNTVLEIAKAKSKIRNPKSARPSEVKLLTGEMWSKVQKLRKPARFAVVTPVATALVKGTEFGVKLQADPSGRTNTVRAAAASNLEAVLTVREGAVEFSNALGKVDVTALNESRATTATAPTPPKRIQTLRVFRLVHTTLRVSNPRLSTEDADTLVCPASSVGVSLIGGQEGPRVLWVCPDSPAAGAGLQPGDLLLSVNGTRLAENAFVARQQLHSATVPMTLALNRLGEQRTVTVQSSAVPTPQILEVQDRLAQATLQWLRARPGSPEADSAAAALEQLAREYPGSAPIQHNVGLLFETRDQLGEAIRRYRLAVELEPDAALFHFSLGEALESIGNFNRALEELNTAVKLAPGVPIFTRCLADVYTFVGRFPEALNVINTGLAVSGDNAFLLAAKAEDLLRQRSPDAALSSAMAACQLNPAYVTGWITLGLVYHDLDRLAEAEAAYRQALALAPDNDVAHLDLANVLLAKGRTDEAETHLRQALRRTPDDSDVLCGLARAFACRGQFAEAETWYRQALAHEPDRPEILSALSRTLCDLGRSEEAEQQIQLALELDSTSDGVQVNWGWLRFKQGHYAEAEQVLLKVLPNTPRGHVEGDLAWVYEGEGKFDQAEAILRQWMQRSPDNPDACNELAELLANRGEKLDEALLLANRAVEAIPVNAAYLKNLGWVYFQRHEWDAAEKPLQEAIERAGRSRTRAIARELLRTVQDKKGNLRKQG